MQDMFTHTNDQTGADTLSGLAWIAAREDRVIRFAALGCSDTLSHRWVMQAAEDMACRLAAIGLRRGDRFGICLPNGPEWVILDLACLRLGLVVAGFDPAKFIPSAAMLEDYGLALLVSAGPAPGCMTFAELKASARKGAVPVWQSHAPDDEVALKFTSGSTGAPKAVAATHGSIGMSLAAVQEIYAHGEEDHLFVFLTLSLLQQRYWVYSALLFGCDLTIACPRTALFALPAARPTVIMGVPAFFETLRAFIEAQGGACTIEAAKAITGGNVRYMWTGSAPIRPELLEWFDETAGLPLFEGYGMNETCIVTKNHPRAHRRGSAGRPVRGKQVWIGEDGVIRVRSAHPVNTRYAVAPEGASERMFDGDTVWTGDLGRIDDDGFLWITGRADDVIVLENGRNVMTREIEERAMSVPGVRHCVLAGSGRPWLVALVDGAADPSAVRAALNDAPGVPADARVRAVLPMTMPPREANGLLTSQGKLVRGAIIAAHADLIEDLYTKELDHA